MGQVVQLRATEVNQTVIGALEGMLARAKCGTLKGWWAIADIEDEQPMALVGGTFAEDDKYALEIIGQGLTAIFGPAPGKSVVAPTPGSRPLPRGLRRTKETTS